MDDRPIDPAALAAAALAAVIAVLIEPGAFNSFDVCIGASVLLIIFAYDAPLPRPRRQILALASVGAFASYIALGFPLEWLLSGGHIAYAVEISAGVASETWLLLAAVIYLVQCIRIDLRADNSLLRQVMRRRFREQEHGCIPQLPWRSARVEVAAWLLLACGVAALGMPLISTSALAGVIANVGAELLGAGVAVLILDRAVSSHEAAKRVRELLALLIGSDRLAAEIARDELHDTCWLYDGTLDGVRLSERNLSGLNLARARLRNALLVRAKLNGTSLIRADLRNANLTGADLTDTVASDDVLRSARHLLAATMKDGSRYDGRFMLPEDERIITNLVAAGMALSREQAYAEYNAS